jgi:hypothetical protein
LLVRASLSALVLFSAEARRVDPVEPVTALRLDDGLSVETGHGGPPVAGSGWES